MSQEVAFSVLNAGVLRPLPIALAHMLAARVGSGNHDIPTLNRLYAALPGPEKAACTAEIARRLASVAGHSV